MWGLLKGPSDIIANIIFFFAAIIFIATPSGWLDAKFSYFTLLAVFYLVPNVCSMNTYIATRPFRSFDFYLFFLYLTGFVYALITSIPDERAISIICGYILGIYLLCTDALPEPVRIITLRFGVPLFATAVFAFCLTIYSGSFQGLEVWHITFNDTGYNSRMIAMSAGGELPSLQHEGEIE